MKKDFKENERVLVKKHLRKNNGEIKEFSKCITRVIKKRSNGTYFVLHPDGVPYYIYNELKDMKLKRLCVHIVEENLIEKI